MSAAEQVLAALRSAASPDPEQRRAGEAQLAQLKTSGPPFLTACTEIFVSAQCDLVGRQLAGLQLKNAITAVMNASNAHPMAPFFLDNAQLQHTICTRGLQDPQRSVRNVAASIVSWAVYAALWSPEQTLTLLLTEVIQKQTSAAGVLAVQGAMRALSQIVSDCVLLLESRNLVGPILKDVVPFLTTTLYFTPAFVQQPLGPESAAVQTANRDAVEVRNAAFDIVITLLDRAAGDPASASFAATAPFIPQLLESFLANVQALAGNRYLYFGFATKACQCLVGALAFHEHISAEAFQRVLHCVYEVTSVATDDSAIVSARLFIAENEREELGIQATGFWSTILNVPRFAEQLEPALGSLIYHLIRQMKYSAFEMSMLSANSNDWNVPDKIDDIKPRHYEAKTQSTAQKKKASASGDGSGGAAGEAGDAGTQGNPNDGDDDDDAEDDDEVREWNLRRVSASTLDDLAEYYGDKVIRPVLECIEGMMQPGQAWQDLEAAVLAFGAICDGCFDSLGPFLPQVAPRFLHILESPDSHFLVVNITLWACTQIGRYFVDDATDPALFPRVMRLILGKMQSPSKLTQEGASEALETMVLLCGDHCEDGGTSRLEPLAAEILNTIATCMRAYQLKNKVLLFEVLQSVCQVMGSVFQANAAACEVILAPLGELWGVVPNDNPLLFSFFSCMGTVCTALGSAVQPMAQSIFDRAFAIMSYHATLRAAAYQRLAQQQVSAAQQQHQGAPSIAVFDDVPEEDYLITAADLLSGLFEALGSSLEPLVAAQQPSFMQMIQFMLTDAESYGVRQSGFALLGDLSRSCVSHVQSSLTGLIEATGQNLTQFQNLQRADPDAAEGMYPVVSNMAWFLCNLLENQLEINQLPTLSTLSAQATPLLFFGLAAAICSGELPKDAQNMAENVVLCLGMLLSSDAELEAKSGVPAAALAKPFVTYMLNIRDLPHRAPALQGFLLYMQSSPCGSQAVLENLTLFFDLAVRMRHDSPDLIRAMKQLLQGAKQANPQLWSQKIGAYTRAMKTQLYQIYGLN